MNNLQLGTTPLVPTGTGLLYTAYYQDGDKVIWSTGSGATRSLIQISRVRPKPTATFPGVDRFEMRRTNYVTVGDNERTCVSGVFSSIPIDVGNSDRNSIAKHIALLVNLNDAQDITNPVFWGVQSGQIPT